MSGCEISRGDGSVIEKVNNYTDKCKNFKRYNNNMQILKHAKLTKIKMDRKFIKH